MTGPGNGRPAGDATPAGHPERAAMSRRGAACEIRVAGHLDERWSAWFGGLTLTREDDGSTTLRGAVADQAELHGLLAKVRDLGAPLLSVTTDHWTGRPGSTFG